MAFSVVLCSNCLPFLVYHPIQTWIYIQTCVPIGAWKCYFPPLQEIITDRQTDQQPDLPTMDRPGHREVTLLIVQSLLLPLLNKSNAWKNCWFRHSGHEERERNAGVFNYLSIQYTTPANWCVSAKSNGKEKRRKYLGDASLCCITTLLIITISRNHSHRHVFWFCLCTFPNVLLQDKREGWIKFTTVINTRAYAKTRHIKTSSLWAKETKL